MYAACCLFKDLRRDARIRETVFANSSQLYEDQN